MFARQLLQTSIRNARNRVSKSSEKSIGQVWKYAVIGTGSCATAGLAYSLYHAVNTSTTDSHLKSAIAWPQYVKDRLRGTFGYCLGGIGVTAGSAVAALRSPFIMNTLGKNTMWSFIGCIALMYGTGALCRSIPFDGKVLGGKSLAYYLHMAVVGAIIAPIAALGGPVCVRAAGLTAAVMAGLATTAMVAPHDTYIKAYGPINAGCFLMLGACVASFFTKPGSMAGAGLMSFVVLGGLVLFSVKGFADIQHTVAAAQRPGQYDPVNHSLHITMDAINIFIRIAQMMAMMNRRK